MMKTTTIYQIAKELKISSSTVSRALKGHPDISAKTKEKVLEMAALLDYEPNMFAVSLRNNSSKEIAIIAPTLSGFYYDSFISAVESEAKKLGYSIVILLSGDNPQAEIQNLKTCRQRRVAGIMLCVTSQTKQDKIFDAFQDKDMPLIFFDKVPDFKGVKSIRSNDFRAAEMAAQELLIKGKQSILAIYGDPNFSITKIRKQAFVQTIEDSKIKVQTQIAFALNSKEAEQAVIGAVQAKRPDAIFCMSDEILIGVMKAIQILGLRIPDDIGIIAISNGFFPKLYFPEITYVETSGYKLGLQAMHLFHQAMQGDVIESASVQEPALISGGSL